MQSRTQSDGILLNLNLRYLRFIVVSGAKQLTRFFTRSIIIYSRYKPEALMSVGMTVGTSKKLYVRICKKMYKETTRSLLQMYAFCGALSFHKRIHHRHFGSWHRPFKLWASIEAAKTSILNLFFDVCQVPQNIYKENNYSRMYRFNVVGLLRWFCLFLIFGIQLESKATSTVVI